MAEHSRQASEQSLMRDMGLTDADIARRLRVVGFDASDAQRIGAIRKLVLADVDRLTASFFDYLTGFEEARGLVKSRELHERARQLKTEHILAMVDGHYGQAYVEQRLKLALLYSKAGLEPRMFLGAFHHLLRGIGALIVQHHLATPLEGFEQFMSLKKIAFFDIGVVVDVLMFERERVIRQQQEAIRELSTPVLQIRDRLLLLPIIGVVDTHRARLITESLLRAIRVNRARVVVMDVTGVANIDSKVANHLLQTVSAAKLMGALVIVTGISSDVAQALVVLGIEIDRFNTIGDLQGGVEEAERLLGLRVVEVVHGDELAGPA
jgi:rsbT co-antagonist protein RsbR